MKVETKTIRDEEWTLIRFAREEWERALDFVLSMLDKAEERAKVRLIRRSEVQSRWSEVLAGKPLLLTGGWVSRTYAKQWRAETSLLRAVARKRGREYLLLTRAERAPLDHNGDLSGYLAWLPEGLEFWLAAGEGQRMRQVLGKRTRRQLAAMGIAGRGLLHQVYWGGLVLVLDLEEDTEGSDFRWTLGLGFRPFSGARSSRVSPLEMKYENQPIARSWARRLQPPKEEEVVRLLRREGLIPKRGWGPEKLAGEGWKVVANELLVRELSR